MMCVYFFGFPLITNRKSLVSAEILCYTVSQASSEKLVSATVWVWRVLFSREHNQKDYNVKLPFFN